MKNAIVQIFIGISLISLISSGVYAGGSVTEKLTMVAGNYDVDKSTTTTTKKGRDGAACSSDDECKGVFFHFDPWTSVNETRRVGDDLPDLFGQ